MEFKEPDFIPMLLQAPSRKELEKFFDGAIPEKGDRVEMYCYATNETSISLKWRVVHNNEVSGAASPRPT